MPWSIFRDGGGPGAALTWAADLLGKISAPLTPANEQVIYDWEVSEGGGGRYNPLNQGPDPGNPSLTSTGSQYGGGAADYVSWSAGLQGAADYLSMPNFRGIADALRSGNAAQARADIIASPWAASHYGGGASFSSSAPPGHASALPPVSPSASLTSSSSGGIFGGVSDALSGLGTDIKTIAITAPAVLAGGALMVWGFARATGARHKAQAAAGHIESAAGRAAAAGALA